MGVNRCGQSGADWFEESFDELYPLLYSHRDLGEARRLVSAVHRIVPPPEGALLDLGCGPGRHLRVLAEGGCVAVGFDLSRPLLDRARRANPGIPLVRGDMRCLPFRRRSISQVLMLFTTFGYFRSREEDASVLQGIGEILAEGGTLVLDYVNAPRLRRRLIPQSGRLVRGMTVVERRWIEPGTDFLFKETRVGPLRDGRTRTYRERLRLYSPSEITEMLQRAGFAMESCMGDYDGGPFRRRESERWIAIARFRGGLGA